VPAPALDPAAWNNGTRLMWWSSYTTSGDTNLPPKHTPRGPPSEAVVRPVALELELSHLDRGLRALGTRDPQHRDLLGLSVAMKKSPRVAKFMSPRVAK